MDRLFTEHTLRYTESLNGAWRFLADPDDRGEAEGWMNRLPGSAGTVAVPSLWNNEMGYLTYEGAGWYEKHFTFSGGFLRLSFGAVMTEAKVWLDGVCLGSHYGGFSGFSFLVPGVSAGEHTLTVRADNRFDADSIPQAVVDWYHFGGIVRGVEAARLEGIAVLSSHAEYTIDDALETADIRFRFRLLNTGSSPLTAPLTVILDGKELLSLSVSLPGGEEREILTDAVTVPVPALWDVGKPALSTVRVSTGTDDLIDRIGFRDIRVSGGEILLNHRKLWLRGVCRHEDHPDWGFAFPMKLMRRDIDILRDLGCNAVRGSHYPNSQSFVDYLDETGILFWSEIPIWGCGFRPDTLARPEVLARGLEMHREMTEQYYNHPSIIIWGMHNEIPSASKEALEMTKLFFRELREKGGNRLVTYASNHPMEDICFDYCDIICLNLYYGWYTGSIENWAGFLEQFRARRRELGMEDKPVIMSEFGAAALFGNHTFDNIPWTEEYQAELFSHCLRLFRDDPMMRGCFPWQFCDIRTSKQAGLNRARGFNNKGILNEYRKPKAAYGAIRTLYREFAREDGEEAVK